MDKRVRDFNVRLRTIKIWQLALAIIASFVIVEVLSEVFPVIYDDSDLYFILVIIFILLFFVWKLRGTEGLGRNFSQLFEPSVRNEILYVFAINIVFAFVFTCCIGWADLFFGFTDPNWVTGFDIDSVDVTPGAFLLSATATIIFAPLIEELMFRGVLFNRLKIRIGIVAAMIVSSFIFAIGHDFGGITSAFLFGICMCILYLKTDNILVPMSVHFINNVVATLLELTPIDLVAAQLPWLIPATVIVVIAAILLIKYIFEETAALKNRFS